MWNPIFFEFEYISTHLDIKNNTKNTAQTMTDMEIRVTIQFSYNSDGIIWPKYTQFGCVGSYGYEFCWNPTCEE